MKDRGDRFGVVKCIFGRSKIAIHHLYRQLFNIMIRYLGQMFRIKAL